MKKAKTAVLVVCVACLLFPLTACMNKAGIRLELYQYLAAMKEERMLLSEYNRNSFLEGASKTSSLEAEMAGLERKLKILESSPPTMVVFSGGVEIRLQRNMVGVTEEIAALRPKLNKSRHCKRNVLAIAHDMEVLTSLSDVWTANSSSWGVRKLQGKVYLVSAHGLGLHLEEPCMGKWYYYPEENLFRPADLYSQALSEKVSPDFFSVVP